MCSLDVTFQAIPLDMALAKPTSVSNDDMPGVAFSAEENIDHLMSEVEPHRKEFSSATEQRGPEGASQTGSEPSHS